MRIKWVHFKDYKRFHDLTIDLGDNPARIIALVGPNGCGKSSVFDGLLFHNNAYNRIGNSNNNWDYSYHSLLNSPGYSYQNVAITFEEGTFEEVRKKRQENGLENTIFSFRSSFRYNGSLNVLDSRAVTELRKNDYGASSSSDIDQRIEQNYRRINIKYNEYMNTEDCRPSEAKSHIIGELNSAIMNCIDVKIDSLGNIESGKGTLYFKKADTDNAFEYNVLSSGEKEVIDILVDLYLRKDEFKDSVYIIDEPELHLNTAIQRKLLLEINKIIPPECQIWIATHSVGFLRALQEDLNHDSQIIEFKKENNWASETFLLQPMIRNRDNLKSLFSTALDDLTELIAPKRIVYCEGRAEPTINGEERGLDAQVYNIIFGESYSDTQFVSSGGNTELDKRSDIALAILTKVFSDIEIWVLKDRDVVSGGDSTEKDRISYLDNNSDNCRILKRFEIENYLYDKSVLVAYCKDKGLDFSESEYDSKIHNINDEHVKEMTGFVKNCCNIKSSINPERFKINLAKYIKPGMQVYEELESIIFFRN